MSGGASAELAYDHVRMSAHPGMLGRFAAFLVERLVREGLRIWPLETSVGEREAYIGSKGRSA